jgi:hypothetical protein
MLTKLSELISSLKMGNNGNTNASYSPNVKIKTGTKGRENQIALAFRWKAEYSQIRIGNNRGTNLEPRNPHTNVVRTTALAFPIATSKRSFKRRVR